MSHKITVGLQKKVGTPNFGSIGASCAIEVQLTAEQAQDGEVVTAHVRRVFQRCRDSIAEELGRHASADDGSVAGSAGKAASSPAANGRPKPATDKQIRMIHWLASKAGVTVASELEDQFGIRSPDALNSRQASKFIDSLKSVDTAT